MVLVTNFHTQSLLAEIDELAGNAEHIKIKIWRRWCDRFFASSGKENAGCWRSLAANI
jgi:hypothetical protein